MTVMSGIDNTGITDNVIKTVKMTTSVVQHTFRQVHAGRVLTLPEQFVLTVTLRGLLRQQKGHMSLAV